MRRTWTIGMGNHQKEGTPAISQSVQGLPDPQQNIGGGQRGTHAIHPQLRKENRGDQMTTKKLCGNVLEKTPLARRAVDFWVDDGRRGVQRGIVAIRKRAGGSQHFQFYRDASD